MKAVVIVGGGQAAMQTVDSLRREGFGGAITLVCEERWLPYQRPPLSKKFLSDELPEERLFFRPQTFYADRSVDVMLETRVTSIDRLACTVSTEQGQSLAYDELVLATGARVRELTQPGADLEGVLYLRGLDDALALKAQLASARHVVVVGGGFIGLEVAAVCRERGVEVTVIEREDRLMARSVSPIVSEFMQEVHERRGVQFVMRSGLSRIHGSDRVASVELDNGATLECDVVVAGIGVHPNVELAQAAGLACDNGICVDGHCRTADEHIYAVGDCTQHFNPIYGRKLRLESVQNAVDQARVAAANLVGRDVVYSEVPWFWSDQYDIKLQMVGLASGYNDIVVRGRRDERRFSVFYFDNNTLLAVDSVNCPADHMAGRKLLAAGVQVSPDMAADENLSLKDLILSER